MSKQIAAKLGSAELQMKWASNIDSYLHLLKHALQLFSPTPSSIIIPFSHFLSSKLVALSNKFSIAFFTVKIFVILAPKLKCVKS